MLNIREEPSVYSAVVTRVSDGSVVTVDTDKSTPDGWTKVSNGYVMTKYLVLGGN